MEGTVSDHTHQIGTLQSDVSALGSRVGDVEKRTTRNTEGIAAAMALPGLAIPAGKKFAVGADVSTYEGKQAIGASMGFAVDRYWSVQGSVGGSFEGGPVGARVGVRAAW